MKLEDIDTLAPRPQLTPRNPPLPVPARSPVRRILADGLYEIEFVFGDQKMEPRKQVEMLVTCYRRAIRLIYGYEPKYMHYSGLPIATVAALKKKGVRRPNISHHRHYARLVAAAEALVKHAIQPAWWAEWYMAKLKEWSSKQAEGKRKMGWGKKAAPIEMIFCAKTIDKRRGWFRNDYDRPPPYRLDIQDEDREQELRIREIHLLNRGMDSEMALNCLPDWYAKKRVTEIEAGHEDPNDFFPG